MPKRTTPPSTTASNRRRPARDSSPREGDVFAVPVMGLGFCPAVITRVPAIDADTDFTFVYLRLELSKRPPRPAEVPPLAQWGRGWLGLVSAEPMRKGRWTHCGQLKDFDRDAWCVPPVRSSNVDETKPIESWGRDERTGKPNPWGEMWSIETTPDEATMTVIDNVPATRERALQFPRVAVVTAASRMEKALVKFFKQQRATFWESPIVAQEITPQAIKRWRQYAARVRAKHVDGHGTWLPAGRKTDRSLAGGEWLGFPLCGGGFGAALLIERPEKHLRIFSDAVVMAMRRRWDRWPTLADVTSLIADDGAIVVQTSMICVRDGRWRVLGNHPHFNKADWPWPRPWYSKRDAIRTGVISVPVASDRQVSLTIDPRFLALDRYAGQRCSSMSPYAAIEDDIPCIINGTHYGMNDRGDFKQAIITPKRLEAWRTINTAIDHAMSAQ